VHVGDTRLYLIRDGQITRVTRDHSYVGRLVESGMISPEQALIIRSGTF
jgi:PPM family protein phosphatase